MNHLADLSDFDSSSNEEEVNEDEILTNPLTYGKSDLDTLKNVSAKIQGLENRIEKDLRTTKKWK